MTFRRRGPACCSTRSPQLRRARDSRDGVGPPAYCVTAREITPVGAGALILVLEAAAASTPVAEAAASEKQDRDDDEDD
jgi:hypothetical protein